MKHQITETQDKKIVSKYLQHAPGSLGGGRSQMKAENSPGGGTGHAVKRLRTKYK